jgi:RNA polymerase sigma-70 factor, ECF subfamily
VPDARDWSTLYRLASRSARRILGDQNDAEDAAQETMLRAYRAFQAGAEPSNLEAWILTIATREAYRIHSRRRPSSFLDSSFPEPTAPDHSEAAIERLELEHTLRDLPADTRELLLRRFTLDQTSSEIALAMNVPAATVRVRLHRILHQLQRSSCLDPERVEHAVDPAVTLRP